MKAVVFSMRLSRSSLFVRLGIAAGVVGLLSAFSFPLVQEGYDRLEVSVYQQAQMEFLRQSIEAYLAFCPEPSWDVNTPTREILAALQRGVDRSLTGQLDPFLPSGASVEDLSRDYRILFRNPQNFRVLPRQGLMRSESVLGKEIAGDL